MGDVGRIFQELWGLFTGMFTVPYNVSLHRAHPAQ